MNSVRQGHAAETPVRLGSQNGYEIAGDRVRLHAEVELPRFSGGHFALELWASDSAANANQLTGVCLASLPVELPAAIAPFVYQVDGWVDGDLPSHGQSRAMVLAFTERTTEGRRVVEVYNFPRLETFWAPHFVGGVGYHAWGDTMEISADSIVNPRAEGNLSGSLALELWAAPTAASTEPEQRLAKIAIEPIHGQYCLPNVRVSAPFAPPPAGSWRISLRLLEWTDARGFVTRDRRNFDLAYVTEGGTPAVESISDAAAKLPKVASVVADQLGRTVSSIPPALPSLQTASIDELVEATGLLPRVVKEIVKSRPFKTFEDLLRVKGIGEKTLRKLKTLVSL